jgi:hypothetical protein
MASTAETLEWQAGFYERFYRMMIGSAADGIFFWWYPGGYRTGEHSDYGVINCDGSDRPVSKVIRDTARKFIDGPNAHAVDTWLTFDRDQHATGLNGVYEETKDAFWGAIDVGNTPGLKTAGTGTTSADCPLEAVGNTPCNGTNPPKYLDGFFDAVWVKDPQGNWTNVHKGGRIQIDGTKPVTAQVTVTNVNEATWLTPEQTQGGPGAINILANGPEKIATPLQTPLKRFETAVLDVTLTKAPITQPTEVTLTLEATCRTPFGPKFTITLEP